MQRKRVVEAQRKIQKSSIETYQIMKKMHINKVLAKELKKEINVINRKEKELIFWKSAYDQNLIEKDRNRSCNIRNIMLN